jgi:Uma2 family endonuclease
MTAAISSSSVYYPSGDGQPVAETFAHLYAILMTIELLRLHLDGQQATVLGNQFMYYAEGNAKKRTAPDVMVIFGVAPGGRDNYKIWEEGQVPQVVFEITSPSTRKEDDGPKKLLYQELGISEYWQFDPKGEWIPEGLIGHRLVRGLYEPIADQVSLALGLRLGVADALITFHRLDSGEKLLLPSELKAAMLIAKEEARLANQQAIELAAKLADYEARFGSLE